jgi:hypothetical protein
VTLENVEFNLLPPSLEETQIKGADNFENLYKSLYAVVYKDQVPDSLWKHKDAEQRLKDIADEAGCSVRLFILCCMLARKTLSPNVKFFANFLFAKNSIGLVYEFSTMARERYGAFDYESLGAVTDGGDQLTQDNPKITDSELLAGLWVVGYKLLKAGAPFRQFYGENELKLDPIWLALEPSYVDYHNELEGISQAVSEHRMEVRRVRRWLSKNKHVAVMYYERRSQNFKRVVEKVLQRHGYALDSFESAPLVHDAMKFWTRLALAIQHFGCLRMAGLLDG